MKLGGFKVWLVILGVLGLIWFACLRPKSIEKYRESNTMGQEVITIDVCLPNGMDRKRAARILDDGWQRLHDVYHRMSSDTNDTDIGRINRSYQNPQMVGEDTIEVLREALRYQKLTHGVFDLTDRSLKELWLKSQKENRMPSEQELQEAQKLMGLSNVRILSGNRVEIMNKNMNVDYDGIATGFAVDELVKILRQRGINNFLIDAAGSRYAAGLNCSRKPWTIALTSPQDKSKIMDVVQVSNTAVSTSGDFERFYLIRGRKFSQMINPLTGYPPLESINATVIAPTAMDNDVLVTTLSVLNPLEGTALIDSLGRGYAGIIITKDEHGKLKVYKSKNYERFQLKRALGSQVRKSKDFLDTNN